MLIQLQWFDAIHSFSSSGIWQWLAWELWLRVSPEVAARYCLGCCHWKLPLQLRDALRLCCCKAGISVLGIIKRLQVLFIWASLCKAAWMFTHYDGFPTLSKLKHRSRNCHCLLVSSLGKQHASTKCAGHIVGRN